MIDRSTIQATSAWPFVEARKLIKERQKIYEKKGKITLQTGYGPSGLPHIGTFAEVARTTMIVSAVKQIIDIPTEIITFSDDMDGLRKIPDMLSKKESTNDKLRSDKKNGIDPKVAILNQERVVKRKTCCKFSLRSTSRLVSTRRIPIKAVTTAEARKMLFFSSYIY